MLQQYNGHTNLVQNVAPKSVWGVTLCCQGNTDVPYINNGGRAGLGFIVYDCLHFDDKIREEAETSEDNDAVDCQRGFLII